MLYIYILVPIIMLPPINYAPNYTSIIVRALVSYKVSLFDLFIIAMTSFQCFQYSTMFLTTLIL